MYARIILNPYSSRWKAATRKVEVEEALRSAGIKFDIQLTDAPHHGTDLAAAAVREGCDLILAAGGDGTISEVVNGILQEDDHGDVTFGILPIGTANDLSDNLGWPRDLNVVAEKIKNGQTRRMDVCTLNGRFFVNNAGLGLEPYISIIQVNMKRLQGNLRYLTAAIRGILDNPQWDMEMEWDGGGCSGPVTLVSIGNCARTGGIFYTVPHAQPFDGQISFIYGYVPTRFQLLKAFPMIMRPEKGNVTEHPSVHEVHTTRLSVRTRTPSPAHADGEVITAGETEFEIGIHPARLNILVA